MAAQLPTDPSQPVVAPTEGRAEPTDATPPAPPLEGLRVLELADGIAGPYAGRLLAMLGATVVKVEPAGGDPARRKQVDDEPLGPGRISPLYLHLNAGKANVAQAHAPPLDWADVVIHNRVQQQLAGGPLDPQHLRDTDGPLLVTVTAWGFEAAEPGCIEDELLVQAASGCIASTGNVGAEPLRLAGWQAQYQAGATAAVGALAALRMPGVKHLDVPWIAAIQVGMELEFADRLMAGQPRPPAGPFPPAGFPGGALPCQDGFVCPGSYRDVDWEMQSIFYDMPELYTDERFSSRAARAQRVEELWSIIQPWYASKTKREIFQYCLDSPWTVGIVLTGQDALADPHLAARATLGPITSDEDPVRAPVRPFRMPGLPVADQHVRATGASPAPLPTATTTATTTATAAALRPINRAPLAGLRMLEFTVAWAGPFVGNFLGSLGMDVIRLEAVRPFEGYRLMRLHGDSDPPRVAALESGQDWLESSNIFCAVNRNKRGLTLDLSTEEGCQVFKDLAAQVDVVVCNFTERVMPGLGLDYETLAALNKDLVVVRMPAFGTTGPYSHCAGYALVVEAMGGFAARWGYPEEGARVSDTYWPDSVAGTHAALAVMTALERRDRTGQGCEVDFSHMDAMWCQLGEGLVVADQRGRDIGRMGNAEPGVADSGIVAHPDGEGWQARVGERTQRVLNPLQASQDPALAYRFETVSRDIIGDMVELRAPVLIHGQPTTTRRPAPLFDQHTDEVLTEVAGYDAPRIAGLRERRVVGGELPEPRRPKR